MRRFDGGAGAGHGRQDARGGVTHRSGARWPWSDLLCSALVGQDGPDGGRVSPSGVSDRRLRPCGSRRRGSGHVERRVVAQAGARSEARAGVATGGLAPGHGFTSFSSPGLLRRVPSLGTQFPGATQTRLSESDPIVIVP